MCCSHGGKGHIWFRSLDPVAKITRQRNVCSEKYPGFIFQIHRCPCSFDVFLMVTNSLLPVENCGIHRLVVLLNDVGTERQGQISAAPQDFSKDKRRRILEWNMQVQRRKGLRDHWYEPEVRSPNWGTMAKPWCLCSQGEALNNQITTAEMACKDDIAWTPYTTLDEKWMKHCGIRRMC